LIIDHQVSTDPITESSILVNTSLENEHQMKVEPSEHMEEVQEPFLEQIHTARILGNTLTWGEQKIPEPIDEVTGI